jgi:hypothetical protein
LDCYCPTVNVHFWTVTVWPLLRFLTISGDIELRFKWNSWRWKGKTWGYKFYIKKNLVLLLRKSKSLINKHLDCYCPTVTVHFWTVTVWPLLRFLTISGDIDFRFKWNSWRWKGKTWGYKFNVWEKPYSASKIVKIAH